MTFKKGDRIRLIRPAGDTEAVFVAYADQAGAYVWVASEEQAGNPSPSTWMADAFEPVPPPRPRPGEVWEPLLETDSMFRVRVLGVCGGWVVHETAHADRQELKGARREDDFVKRYRRAQP